jgi:hypothetical protein
MLRPLLARVTTVPLNKTCVQVPQREPDTQMGDAIYVSQMADIT